MNRLPMTIARSWRLVRAGRNPLARGWERLEAGLLIGAALCALLALPLAVLQGAQAYADQLELSDRQRAERHPATAVTLSNAPDPAARPDGTPTPGTAQVPARWTVIGSERRGNVTVNEGTAAGAAVPIWLDPRGDLVAAPVTAAEAAATGIGVGTAIWLSAITVLGGLYWVGRKALDRSRAAEWEREWSRIAPDWTRH
ncbi:Rv1733c family protein [Amycolatopsis anabasis]|uniref:Rv1733c family protein n=1 Tax=Amycolatopsis anabasis TaxID=1840409 RepID=UPI00131B04B4|nr:hypothetical protein [Amycolatopsis anabasis]